MTVRPFSINVPEMVLDRIAKQLSDSRIGYSIVEAGWIYGTDAQYLVELIDHWRTRYDWRKAELELNRFPQFIADVNGVDIHFYHVRGDGSRPYPIMLTHGWPGSVLEFLEVIPLLVAEGWDVVVPSLPGYGWSGKSSAPMGPKAVADMWRSLMIDHLGYGRFGAQGGDWGSVVTCWLGYAHADVVTGIHLNIFLPLLSDATTDHEAREYWNSVAALRAAEGGYQLEQSTKPQTIGLALHDHPVGWAAWVIEKFNGWREKNGSIEDSFSKDQLITNLMIYLVNDAVISSMWLYYGLANEQPLTEPIPVPAGLAMFPGELYPYPSRRLAERRFNVHQWSNMEAGGHFAALEQPELFAADVARFFGSLS